jgi:hypothetical protein
MKSCNLLLLAGLGLAACAPYGYTRAEIIYGEPTEYAAPTASSGRVAGTTRWSGCSPRRRASVSRCEPWPSTVIVSGTGGG